MTPLIETILGLVFVFLAFSLITSWVTEYLAMVYQQRGKMLRKFLSDALDDRFNEKNWGLMLYAHPLVESLGREVSKFRVFNKLGTKRRLPHYIPGSQFATAFIENILAHNRSTVFTRDTETGKHILAMEESSMAHDPFAQFVNSVESLQESEVKQTLQALVRTASVAANPMESVRTGLMSWYDSGMERVSGWYKRDTRGRLFRVGLVVAVVFNVNTFDVLHSLWVNPQLRTAVAAAADDYLARNPELPGQPPVQSSEELKSRIREMEAVFSPLALPLGWPDAESGESEAEVLAEKGRTWRLPKFHELWPALLKNWIGWLVTAAALSFGAPFWFDALKRVANMRSAGTASRTVPTGGVPPTR